MLESTKVLIRRAGGTVLEAQTFTNGRGEELHAGRTYLYRGALTSSGPVTVDGFFEIAVGGGCRAIPQRRETFAVLRGGLTVDPDSLSLP